MREKNWKCKHRIDVLFPWNRLQLSATVSASNLAHFSTRKPFESVAQKFSTIAVLNLQDLSTGASTVLTPFSGLGKTDSIETALTSVNRHWEEEEYMKLRFYGFLIKSSNLSKIMSE